MAGLWKRDGTVAVTSGSKKVTGTGTTFADAKNGVAKGHLFCMTTGATVDLYEVDYVVSNTELFLVQAFRGVTGTGKAYEVITTFSDSIPEFARKLNASLSYYQGQSDMVQQLFTSDAAEITVTAPDGTTHKLIPWKRVTSDGEGQAARAKVEADRSKTEADRSGTEADRAAGIVAAAALPLPDVWAPLSDSLRLITGYGRDVLVGSDVVARMVNFSRSTTATYIGKDGQLKTAAANEPRFEKEGLLIEGQSSNIVTNSNVFTPFGAGATKVDNQTGPFGANDATRIDTVNAYTGTNPPLSSPLVDGAVYTTSVWLRGAVGGEVVRIGIHNATIGLGVTLTTEWKRYSITQTRAAGTNSAFVIQAASAPISFFVYGVQLEALPFASSYIPTAGAAVTRAKDILYLAPSGNVPSDINMAFAAQVKLMGKGLDSWPRVLEISDPANKGAFIDMNAGTWGGVNIVGVKKTLAVRFSDRSRWLEGINVASQWQGYPAKVYNDPVYICGAPAPGNRDFYGHVRNLRAWFFSPTDDQMRAIR
ncbi:hypothetical protein BWQ95_11050 [Aeromonas hydrophila]|uniref:phage head spike fiber domain-containing protein n=1 Tax=Aeromonas TaxID=642 RepID=UPI0009D4C70B|nr:hypothetical protein [Aeromonas hydrophila]ONG09100.1 hypothetical protein BWQ95_11050 [Aeromonas hydrophila]